MGKNLAQTVIAATGLPQAPVEREFNALLAKHAKDPESLTLEELREVMAEYLQIVFLEMHSENDISA